MELKSAVLIIRYKGPDGWKRAKPARSRNGRISQGVAMIGGHAQPVENYYYQVRTFQNRKIVYTSVGSKAAEAEAQRQRIEKQSTAKAVAEDAGLTIMPGGEDRKTLAASASAYINDAEARGAMEAALQARSVSGEFCRTAKRIYLDEVTREDILRFHATLRARGCGDRTVSNKHARLKSWLVFAGVQKSVIPPAPKYDAKLPTTYTREAIRDIYAAADPYMRLVLDFGLKLGLREQEIAHCEWSDIHWSDSVLRVSSKPQWGFRVKDSEERDIPIPAEVKARLKTLRSEKPKSRLVLGTAADQPNRKLLRKLKGLANRADLNCGSCEGCKVTLRQCQEWTLHRLRRTYATTLLRAGLDLRTVQALMGHADLASTMRYLRPATGSQLRGRIEAVKWGA